MSTSGRSTTGCTACKARRKKCDEGKPQCQRCLTSGIPCGYEFIAYPDSVTHLIQRTKPAPRPEAEILAKAAKNDGSLSSLTRSGFTSETNFSQSRLAPRSESVAAIKTSSVMRNDETEHNLLAASFGSAIGASPVLSHFSTQSQMFPDTEQVGASWIQPIHIQSSTGMSSGGGATPSMDLEMTWPYADNCGIDEDDPDPEGVQTILSIAPAMDSNLKENTLPFVLQSYSRWAIVAVFEPLKIAHSAKEMIVQQLSSEDTRTRCILIANVMHVFGRQLTVDEGTSRIVSHLTSEVRKKSSKFLTESSAGPHSPELNIQDALHVLDGTLEVFTLQIYTQPMTACIQLLEDAAPAFRCACSELPGQLLNLSTIILESSLNIQHYAAIDIMTSALTGRPTLFKYHVPFSLEICERIYQIQENCGLYWLHGVPDQFIMMLAWINSLCEVPGAGTDLKLIARIEEDLQQIRFFISQSGDSALRIGRIVVQECWRHVMSIYLYMALCGANAKDLRVIRAQRGFMRLVKGIKPGRNPDAFLVSPMIIAGVATSKERDCDILRRRVLILREYATPRTSGNDAWMQVEDVWARTKSEGRAAVWSDLRVACFRVSGK
ncbi:hypothetical protein RHS03_00173, partial [Rhizoctonia solani]